MSRNATFIIGMAGIVAAIASGPAAAQGSGPHSLGAFVGLTDRDDADITIGAESEYQLDPLWAVGAVVEYTRDAFRDEDATVVMGTVNFYPVDRFRLIGGLGVEFTDFDDEIRVRLGAGYDVFTAATEGFRLTPRLSVDFGDRDESVVFGATLAFPF